MYTILLLLALFASAQALQKRVEPATGEFCGKITCTHPGGLFPDVGFADVEEVGIQYYSEDKGRAVELYYALLDAGSWIGEENLREIAELQHVGGFQFTQDSDSIVVTGMIRDPIYCQNHVRYSCYMGYNGAGGTVYVDTIGDDTAGTIDDDTSVGGGDTDDDEPTVQMAVINIMSTMADEVEELHTIMDVRANVLFQATDSVRDQIETDGDHFVEDLKTGLDEISNEVETLKSDIGEKVTDAYNVISMDVGLNTQTLETELQTLVTQLEKQLDSQEQGLGDGANVLNDTVIGKISELSQVGENNIRGLEQSLKTGLTSLEIDIESSGSTTFDLFTSTNAELQQQLSKTEDEAKRALKNVETLADGDITSLGNSFTEKVQNLNGNLNQSLDTTKLNLDKNSASFTNAFTQQMAQLQDSTKTVGNNLKTSVNTTSKELSSELETEERKVNERLDAVKNVISTQSTDLKTEISNQEVNVQREVNASTARASKSLSETKDKLLETTTNLKTMVSAQIGTVSKKLSTEHDNLKANISQLASNSESAVEGLSTEVSTTLTDLEGKTTEGIDGVQSKISNEIGTLDQRQATSSDSQIGKTASDLTNVGTKLSENTDALSSSVNDKINTLNTNTATVVATMTTDVETNINTVGSQVDTIDKDITTAINTLSQTSQTSLETAFTSLETQVGNLEADTLQVIGKVAQDTESTLRGVSVALNVSVNELEEESLTKLSGTQTHTADALANLKTQSEGISQHVKDLGGEIATEQGKLTELLTKFGDLTKQLGDVTTQVTEFQTGLTTYKDRASKMFTDTNTNLTTRSESTLGLMSGVVNKISLLTNGMETALTTFHTNVQQLGRNIEDVGTNVGVFVNSNIDDIIGHMDNNTARITSYLQPKKCARNMNYASISNTQYVVISPNDESTIDFDILCDTATDGGGWIVIQRRKQNNVVFYRNWQFYKEGFGNMETDFYMGNDRIHELTTQGDYELRITLEKDEQEYIATYDTFSIDGEDNLYTLHIDGYSGTAGDAMAYHNGMPFSTSDRDNDEVRRLNCAMHQQGAWWYKECRHSNLNGDWESSMDWSQRPIRGVVSSTEMKIRLKK